jgi:uncharacterized membrane protein YfcA
MEDFAIMAGSGLAAGAMNALAGGGSFVTLPALIATGLPSVSANATSSVALWPGGLASAIVYRERPPVAEMRFPVMLGLTLAGGGAGALLLLATPVRLFDQLLPWLLVIATLALAFAPRIAPHLEARTGRHGRLLLVGQFLLGVYGGYYGGAVGLMMLAMWSLIDGAGIKALAGTRTAMVAAANAAAILCFAVAGVVAWRAVLIVGAGALAGGYAGARIGRRLPPELVRVATLILCIAITIAFFIRAYR